MKKILIVLIASLFVLSMLPGIMGEKEASNDNLKLKKYKEDRDIIPILTEKGLVKAPAGKGKPVYEATITSPADGADVSGIVTITIAANALPYIYIDTNFITKGYSYDWDTTTYADGDHTIFVDAKGAIDDVTVTVDNGGSPPINVPPVADFSYAASNLAVDFFDDSSDSDGSVEEWYWTFGDGATSTAQNPSYTYESADTYTVSLTVTDNEGATDSTSQYVTVTSGSSGGDGIVKKYALVIGISDYEGTANDLTYCDEDADDWAAALQSRGYQVTKLVDQQATADNIETKLYDLMAAEDGDDNVALVYSGHGYGHPEYGSCIISQDLYYMTHGYFEQFFDMAESQHIFVSFDACEIGDFQGLVDTNRVGAFASNSRYSYDGDSLMKNGVFTYYQMEGWGIYDSFEEDSAYAVQEMKDWPTHPRIKVDPFYVDNYAGLMMP